ncbi:Alpha-galactosidase A precursor [Sedimentisphaera cyanobacteriorum]|uniref:Alpha-galactosidase n=1 Tax=Sedimentisphaera cyanobacteriorum TaxID=1940790 RepID=A0A1Q2HSY2_9BACT|nr:NPCBM/NEW2 domain-containing protein [Sedimentisphaera cyanobacteriorum]AQQ10471.1 Alpha-galactosidase A precursor [Sedimentisphaera cyanobacteriorum]
MRKTLIFMLISAAFCFAEKVYLSDLDISNTRQGWGEPMKDKSVAGNPIKIKGKTYKKGLGTHSHSILEIKVNGAERFKALAGINDEVIGNDAEVRFIVLADGEKIFRSGRISANQKPAKVDVSLKNAKKITLVVEHLGSNNFDHADWADAYFIYSGKKPETIGKPEEKPYILTPEAPKRPLINSAKVFGVRPGSPVLYHIAATGKRPMKFTAYNLPDGLKLNSKTGDIRGTLNKEGTYEFTAAAENEFGRDSCEIRFEAGDKICLTPPLGWNSWNCWGCAVNEDKIKDAADSMVESGLINYGWQYINIDDCWMREPGENARDEEGNILCNDKFPDMKGLVDYIHEKGLKAGTYISPGPWTCQRLEGSWEHEMQDAMQFAEWGFDYLKYDWCGYRSVAPKKKELHDYQKPYIVMRECLDEVPRDIVYSLCQYGMADVWKWGAEVGGNCWRTTGDIRDTWGSVSNILNKQKQLYKYSSPGHWNDPDMLVVGEVGWGPNLHKSRLSPSEQYTHITMWSMLNSPLLIGCDMTKLDDFTLNLLCNREVIAVNQDPLGKQARIVSSENDCEVWLRELEGGDYAAAIVNMGYMQKECEFDFAKAGLSGEIEVRDLWRQKDLGTYRGVISFKLPTHGCRMLKLTEK